jgi:hypothetical protein
MYEQLREEVRAHGKRKTRRYLGSFTVLGVIIGYIFTTGGDARVLVLAPYVLAFLYLSHISSMNYVVQLAALLALIELKLDTVGAEYGYYHGGFSVSTNPRFTAADLDDGDDEPETPQETVQSDVRYGMAGLAVLTYLGASVAGVAMLLTKGLPEISISSIPLVSLTPVTGISIFSCLLMPFCWSL